AGGVVVAGNGTLEAARALGWEVIATVSADDLDETQRTAFAIADNRTAELADWDAAKLAEALALVTEDGDELGEATGFDHETLVGLIEQERGGEVVEDEGPGEVPADPITKEGDLWLLGYHRVLCGDCRNESDVDTLMNGDTIAVGVTSPPYASQRKYDESSGFKPIHPDEYLDWFEPVQANIAQHIAGDGSWFVNIKEHCDEGQRVLYVKDLTLAHVRRWGWNFVDEFIWNHGGTPKAVNQRFKNGWEPIFQFTRGRHKFRPDHVRHQTDDVPDWKGLHPNMEDVQRYGCTEGMKRKGVDSRATRSNPTTTSQQGKPGQTGGYHNPNSMAYPSNVLSLGKNREALGHSAAYPVSLPMFFVKAFSDDSDIVYDPFLGSGTTLIAAEQLGRKCYGLEISPAYCDVIVNRWEKLTGEKAVNAKTGEPFPPC
ncbi:MAG TPA: hypothetical protein EYF98_10945, partial [Planctomycetes bacterium]|nr:hypothetical protein [Planctomycetota bacterium]